jgi:peptidoglycan hydrolase-like protein with peptidoglycan-binding domain
MSCLPSSRILCKGKFPPSFRSRWRSIALLALALSLLGYTPLLPHRNKLATAQSIESLPPFKFGSRTLELGMAGTDVIELQRRLKQLGYFEDSVTGIFDRPTQDAVLQFQRDFLLEADGTVGTPTQTALLEINQGEDVWQIDRWVGLRQGSRGVEVQQLQLLLQNQGFTPRNIDGRFGTDTESALMQFQRFYGLSATGVVDERTAIYLNRVKTLLPEPYIVPEIEETTLYVVVIPQGDDKLLFQNVRWFFPDATLVDTDRRGIYVEAGRFLDRDVAEARSNLARDRGFDARVVYLRNQPLVSEDKLPLAPLNIPPWRPLPVPF